MRVLFAAAECVPFVKTGGLADVVGALPQTLIEKGIEVSVVLPFYSQIKDVYRDRVTHVTDFTVHMGWKDAYCGIKKLVHDNVEYYFIDNEAYFKREGLYGHWDDGERFAFFSLAVCEMMTHIDLIPNVIHVHDWHTAMIPVLLVNRYHWDEKLKNVRKVLTIHNLKFQGIYSPEILESMFGISQEVNTSQGVKYYDCINFLQGGIQYSDRVTTVSPQYAKEIQTAEFGEHLDGVLKLNDWKLQGILNGIDQGIYNPATDLALYDRFSSTRLPGKYRHKEMLQHALGLPVDASIPMIVSISRLTDQKGFNLVADALPSLMNRNVQYVVLGTGDAHYESLFKDFAARYPDKMVACIDFDAVLAQRIYAASDLFLMPSAFEPCGLSQLIAYRYGSVPIVHATGGLKDTIQPYNKFDQTGTGFSFEDFNSHVMMQIIDEALSIYSEKTKWKTLVRSVMRLDYGWDRSADAYITMYQELMDA